MDYKTFKRYKRRRPKIPEFTCTEIDNIISKLEMLHKEERRLTKFQLKLLTRKLERLRLSNEALRNSGHYWYTKIKQMFERK